MLPHLLALLRLRAVLPLSRFDEFSAFAIIHVDGPPQLRDALVAEREDVDRLPMAECRLNLCRRTPFMRSSLHVTKVMMLNMIMTTRRGCGSLRNLYASAVGHLS